MIIHNIEFNHYKTTKDPINIDVKFSHGEINGVINLHYENISNLTLEELMKLVYKEGHWMIEKQVKLMDERIQQ